MLCTIYPPSILTRIQVNEPSQRLDCKVVCHARGPRPRFPRVWKTRNRIGTISKSQKLVESIKELSNVKEEVYGALDSFIAWDLEFPLIVIKKALKTLEFQKEWKRIIQVIKWMLSKGQGQTLGTYYTLLNALAEDGRLEEAEELWTKIFSQYLESLPRIFFMKIISLYYTVSSDVSLLASGKLISSFAAKASEENGENVVNAGHIEDGSQEKKLIWIDPASCCLALYSNLNSDQVLMQQSPLALAKAIKNHFELDGLRKAHIRDGAAVVQYLVWLDGEMQKVYGAAGFFTEPEETHKRKHQETEKLTEVSVSDKLESFRAKKEHFKGLSFPTISSVGPNASIIHYKPEAGTCAELDADSIYLFDSGAQYQDGTTDITRTVHFGKPSAHEKACYTAVLKGHIALGNAVFPNGTTGHTLDILSRIPLWKNGLDYRHGTGHGIGSYLNVHEGPHLISFKHHARNVPLQASMTVTDEPGYYEDGNFGIRLENVLVVKEADTKFNFGEKGYLSFEHITWAPYQKKLMNLNLMTPEEISWVNSYHSTCKEVLAPYLNDQEMEWLKKATEPIASPAS